MREPHFSYRDNAWVARARWPAGEWARRYFTVLTTTDCGDGRRRPATDSELKVRKDNARREAAEWQDAVSQGASVQ